MINEVLIGDCKEVLKSIPENTFDTCITSPPYYGLRSYTDDPAEIGGEQSPEEFVANLVSIFSEVRRTLKKDGTCWLNIGDSYYNYRPGKGQSLPKQSMAKTNQDLPTVCARRANKLVGIKEKELIGIPWMLAFALRADGWYLRQDIIWNKTNSAPESVADRCTKSHEYVFLLTKDKNYYFDQEAIKEPTVDGKSKKNKRSVWNVGTSKFRGQHFATFPPELIEPCVLAGSPEGGLVLDPFGGSGTTALVAKKHKRNYTMIELNPEYAEICKSRLEND